MGVSTPLVVIYPITPMAVKDSIRGMHCAECQLKCNCLSSIWIHDFGTSGHKRLQQAPASTASTQKAARRKGDSYYCEKDLSRTLSAVGSLQEGCFYFPDISSSQAKAMLRYCDVGTFFIRDSSDSRYLFTLSVSTKRGPTSIRILYEHGMFSLDADEKSRNHLPKFDAILNLIDYYVRQSSSKTSDKCRFLDTRGKKDLPIIISKPKLSDVPSLKHLCRTAIIRSLPVASPLGVTSVSGRLPLPKLLHSYIKDYPFVY
ncbi:suppressor of cytokine signaling 2-like [Dreissena polymorpha]|uniref:Suppressor of cytokine signaling 2 n=1 Tax=Dreissena polymorpha TaxID=45954 RepID=A0A9D4CW97_DREPO|nr:suppressor of cytokine signaling 2-like [Dreissena polymorpha]XP_052263709.1 suppressor of cytokine signaling 2-like [Dreissena polymorpha]KAH3734686.1 hypothetical protein DPMN_041130 [Dreissena polymorpha]KAH3864493.1 hypothetical protein DPMN_027511 [Dreissena polymorpha]